MPQTPTLSVAWGAQTLHALQIYRGLHDLLLLKVKHHIKSMLLLSVCRVYSKGGHVERTQSVQFAVLKLG